MEYSSAGLGVVVIELRHHVMSDLPTGLPHTHTYEQRHWAEL